MPRIPGQIIEVLKILNGKTSIWKRQSVVVNLDTWQPYLRWWHKNVRKTLATQKQMHPGLKEKNYGGFRICPQMQNIMTSSWFSINTI